MLSWGRTGIPVQPDIFSYEVSSSRTEFPKKCVPQAHFPITRILCMHGFFVNRWLVKLFSPNRYFRLFCQTFLPPNFCPIWYCETSRLLTQEDHQKAAYTCKERSVRLTGSSRRGDIADHLIAMGKIEAVWDVSLDDDTNSDNTEISYITSEVIRVLWRLPPFESVKDWSKDLNILSDFTFMNLLIYLVYGKDKSFDMHALKSFKSLKAHKFFYDGFVKNV